MPARPDPPTSGPPETPRGDAWRRVRAVVEELLEVDEIDREQRLADRVLSDDDRALVRALVAESLEDDPLDLPPLAVDSADLASAAGAGAAASAGDRVGPWELRQRLGVGGMGEVWAAVRVDGEFTQRVAIKRLHASAADDEVIARFRRERQVLASLEDPAIARLVDGGVDDDGRPYLAMEYVDGVPIDEYCETHAVGLDGRVGLLAQAARAVDAAHGRLVVHRDLKPSNVLVDRQGRPRLIDFGVAKVLDPERDSALVTRDVARYLTPSFASPEQFTGGDVTPASDVYSLGALAYALIAGGPPLELTGLGPADAVKRIVDESPQPPSAATQDRNVTRDLDAIVLRCLRKEPARRYGRAGEVADELERWSRGEPVFARRDGWTYRSRRFVQRHRTVVSLTALVVLTLSIGLGVTLSQRDRLEAQSTSLADQNESTERLLDDLRNSIESLTTVHYPELAALPGTEGVLARMTRSLAAIAARQGDPRLTVEAIRALTLSAENTWSPFTISGGDPGEATKLIDRARDLRSSIGDESLVDPIVTIAVADFMSVATRHAVHCGEFRRALASRDAEDDWLLRAMSADRGGVRAAVAMAWVHHRRAVAIALERIGRTREAVETLEEAVQEGASWNVPDSLNDTILRWELANLDLLTARFRSQVGLEPSDASRAADLPNIGAAGHAQTVRIRDNVRAMTAVHELLDRGELEAARSVLDEALERVEASIASGPAPELPSMARIRVRYEYAHLSLHDGRPAEARRHAAGGLAELERIFGSRRRGWVEDEFERSLELALAMAHAGERDVAEAARLYGLVLDDARSRLDREPRYWTASVDALDACMGLAELQTGRDQRARWMQEARGLLEALEFEGPEPTVVGRRRERFSALVEAWSL